MTAQTDTFFQIFMYDQEKLLIIITIFSYCNRFDEKADTSTHKHKQTNTHAHTYTHTHTECLVMNCI